MGEYKKPWLTLEEQADLLIGERGSSPTANG